MKPRSKTILTCAVTGGAPPPKHCKGFPITPKEIAQSAIESAKAGAAIVHLHVRDPESGQASMEPELYREVVDRIRNSTTDVVLNLTTSAGAYYTASEPTANFEGQGTFKTPAIRMRHIEENRPEICTLDCGSLSLGNDVVMVNAVSHLIHMAEFAKELQIKLELEVFDTGNLRFAKALLADGIIMGQPFFQICLGIPWGIEQTPESMMFMKDQLPKDAHWASFGIESGEFPMLAQAALLGGHVRVGMEDNIYLEEDVVATSNAALVEKGMNILYTLGCEPANPKDARTILGLK